MFLNSTHQLYHEKIGKLYPDCGQEKRKVLNLLISIPPIYEAFESRILHQHPLNICKAFLTDYRVKMTTMPIKKEDESMIQLIIDLCEGETEPKSSFFHIGEAMENWNEDYTNLFLNTLELSRPMWLKKYLNRKGS